MSELDDVLRVDSDVGDLLLQVPENDVANLTANISLACWSQAIREDRSWSEFQGCFSLLFSLFSLERVEVTGWPLALTLPWERGSDDTAAAASSASAAAPAALAYHDETTHTHTYTHSHGDLSGFDLFFFILVFGTLFLFLGLCAADSCAAAYATAPPPARDRKGQYEAVAA